MARVRDFMGEVALSEWAQLLKAQTDDLMLLAKVHENARSKATREAVFSVLDSMEDLLRGAQRALEQEKHDHEAHRLRSGPDAEPKSRPTDRGVTF